MILLPWSQSWSCACPGPLRVVARVLVLPAAWRFWWVARRFRNTEHLVTKGGGMAQTSAKTSALSQVYEVFLSFLKRVSLDFQIVSKS